jgi:hypothetical protein
VKSGHEMLGSSLSAFDPKRTLTLHAYHLARSKLRMLRVIPLSGQFGITRHGDNTFSRSPSSFEKPCL